MNEPTTTQTQANLHKLAQLMDQLSDVLDSQQLSVPGAGYTSMAQRQNDVIRLLTQARLTTDALKKGVETQEKERLQLRALQEVSAAINSSLEQTEVLNIVMDTIIQLTGAERGFLMLFDEESGELEVEVARNINRETIEEASFEISRSIVKSVAETGEAVVTTNAQADPRFAGQESIISYSLRSILCVPLKIKDHITGVIYADNRIVSGIFVDTDRDLLTSFANQAAVAIDNARLFRQIRDQLTDITELKNLQDDVFESMASGVITIDTDNRISLYNRAAERILGIPAREVMSGDYRHVLYEVMGEVIASVVEKIKRSGGHFNMELDANLRHRPGTATLNLNFSPLRDIRHETLGVAIVFDDVSEKKRLESVRRYLPPALVDQVRDVDTVQQPQRREITVLFADVRGYSTKAEHIEPEQLIEIINGYLTVAAQTISDNEGLIDKYDGDAVMALFNTPLNPQEDHAGRAVRTAIKMRESLDAYRAGIPREQHLSMGIGVKTGEAVVGNVGSPLRKDYSAIGDAVNVAKRFQEIATPNQILVSASTYARVSEWLVVRDLEPVQLKGRQGLEQIYEVIGLKEPAATQS